jgi:methyl-accepting chemotaxis protein
MFDWFGNHLPIRQKFTVLLAVNLLLTGMASAVAVAGASGLVTLATAIVIAFICLSGTLLTGLASKHLICTPYVSTVVRMEQLAAGDLTSPIGYADNRDCVGRMTKAMAIFRRNAEQVQDANRSGPGCPASPEMISPTASATTSPPTMRSYAPTSTMPWPWWRP